MSDTAYWYLGCHEDMWFCFRCSLPQLSDSYFDAEDHMSTPPDPPSNCSQLSVTNSSSANNSDLNLTFVEPEPEVKKHSMHCRVPGVWRTRKRTSKSYCLDHDAVDFNLLLGRVKMSKAKCQVYNFKHADIDEYRNILAAVYHGTPASLKAVSKLHGADS